MRRVFISTTTFGADDPLVLNTLAKAKLDVTMNPHARRLDEEEIIQVLVQGRYDGLLAGLEPLTKKVFSKAKGLKVISRVGVGLDNVDQKAARELGIKVFNTPGVLTDAVAELTLGLILSALRKICLMDRKMHAGVWEKKSGSLLKGKTLGIIGFGHIGQRVACLARVFEANIIYFDIVKIKSLGSTQCSLNELLKRSDIISIHSGGKECLIGPREIELLKKGAILINTARGNLVDEKALDMAVASGKIACAALDVFCEEPYQGKMTKNENIILTPHIGSYAKEARLMMEKMAVDNLIKGLKGVK